MPLITKTRQLSCRLYNNLLRNIPEVTVPASDFVDVTPFLYYIRVPAKYRDKFRAHLTANGIDTGVHWQPGHHFSLFSNVRSSSLQVTDKISKEIVSLPLHSNMSEETVELIASAVNGFFSAAS
jgi:dTDP-4-amino-4,6-dideoxygalactose transaminase